MGLNSNFLNKLSGSTGQSYLNDDKVVEILRKEAVTLEKLIQNEISYYKTQVYPHPKEYRRTGRWEKSIYITEPEKDRDGHWIIKLKFDRNKALHPSYVKGGKDGYVPWLMEVGWEWKKRPPFPYMFGQYGKPDNPHVPKGGSRYIQKAVRKYNAMPKPFKIKVVVTFDDFVYYDGDQFYK